MGILLDTSILVATERGAHGLLPDDEVGIAAITASELLHGVLRASQSARPARTAFVEAILSITPVKPFGLVEARVHADIWAALTAVGRTPGTHDLLIAATAVALGWPVATLNPRHFQDVPSLTVLTP